MSSRTILHSMENRDPFLRSNLNVPKYQHKLHQSYSQLSQNISELLKPPTPEKETTNASITNSGDSKGRINTSKRKPRVKRTNSTDSCMSILDKYRIGIPVPPSVREPSRMSTRSNRSVKSIRVTNNKEENKSNKRDKLPVAPSAAEDRFKDKYCIRYSKVLDIFKRKLYDDLIQSLGIDINSLDDPSLVEIDLAWCRPGAGYYIHSPRNESVMQYSQLVNDTTTTSILGDREDLDLLDDRMSVYSSYTTTNFLPPISRPGQRAPSVRGNSRPNSRGRSVRSVKSEIAKFPTSDTNLHVPVVGNPLKPTKHNEQAVLSDYQESTEKTSGKTSSRVVTKLPVIGEHSSG